MKTVQINVGLSNNPMNSKQITEYFASLKGYRLMAFYFKDMLFEGAVEPTFVALLEYKYTKQSRVLTDAENWANVMEQQSIAVVTDFMQVLAFNTSYSGSGYLFDAKLFEFIKL